MKIEIRASASIGKLQLFECHEYEGEGKDKKLFGIKIINIKPLKEMGIIKRSNSYTKAEQFLNSEDGMKWYQDAENVRI